MGAKILGIGSWLPGNPVLNDLFAKTLDTNDEWIKSRTGISQRHFALPSESNSYLAVNAAKLAIEDSGLESKDIDLVIVSTTTPDNSFPSVSSEVQAALGLGSVPSFDIQAVCSGFVYGLHIVDSLLLSGKYSNILLIGSEKMSSLLDFQDRSTCCLFGDGAGAMVLSAGDDRSSIIDSVTYSDGSYREVLHTDGGVALNQKSGYLRMNGSETFKHAISKMSDVCSEILDRNNLTIDQIDYFIPHQANIRIMDAVGKRLGLDDSKLVNVIDRHANCSAASIPLAFDVLKREIGVKRGQKILIAAFGAGFTWGAVLLDF